ncbi:hypothetical protein A3B93_01110 [Candidatus Nomurabacteria bacterium RIFCSPHIGHO2_02_FULL_42_24]|uniref:Uncharacterized protein n=1 Tax=Candidatus Nomurabacteria bacterium RIFCSPHIGHO2_02_FULL_42_24 TaxID=1801757 RepID=A0A1F6WHS6_9BACT|nr:MAG: hypothetical protein A3B93_01110 [Candidatus Nomurabacteria bacterium RIFCSPHIGHO2_02_FULL_42_24]
MIRNTNFSWRRKNSGLPRGRGGRGVWGAPKQSKARYGVKIPPAERQFRSKKVRAFSNKGHQSGKVKSSRRGTRRSVTKSYEFLGSKRNCRFSVGKENFSILILKRSSASFFFVLT